LQDIVHHDMTAVMKMVHYTKLHLSNIQPS